MHGCQDFRGILHFPQTCACHFEDGYLGGGTESVLDTAQDAVRVAGVALELQDYVHYML